MQLPEGTVTINLKDYTDLVKFKETIESGGTAYQYMGHDYRDYFYYYSKEESVKDFVEKLNSMQKRINDLEGNPQSTDPTINATIEALKKMSICQFLKWRGDRIL